MKNNTTAMIVTKQLIAIKGIRGKALSVGGSSCFTTLVFCSVVLGSTLGMSSGGLGGLRVVVVSGTVSSVKSSCALVVLGGTC